MNKIGIIKTTHWHLKLLVGLFLGLATFFSMHSAQAFIVVRDGYRAGYHYNHYPRYHRYYYGPRVVVVPRYRVYHRYYRPYYRHYYRYNRWY